MNEKIKEQRAQMKTFKDFTDGKGYINLSVTDDDKKKLFNILKKLGIKDYIQKLHLTLMYDRSNPKINVIPNDKKYSAKIVTFKTLGEPDSKWYSIALGLESQELNDRYEELKKMGFTHSYPTFVAHVSLKYKPSEDDIKTLNDNIDLFKELGNIHLCDEKIKKIEG